MITVFGTGSFLSFLSVFKPHLVDPDEQNNQFIQNVAHFHWIISEVEISAAYLVDLVTWVK